MLGRQRSRIDRIRERVEPTGAPASASLAEAIARLSFVVERNLRAVADERAEIDRLRSAFGQIPQGVVLADADGEVAYRNRAAGGFVDARHGEALVSAAIDELIGGAVGGRAERRTIDLFGPPRRAIQLRSGPLRADERPDAPIVGAFVLVEDITERQRLEAVRRDFVANISHELKTPVGALGVLAESLAGETDPAVVERMAVRMQREAFRLANTIDDLLQLSRIEADQLPEPERVDVAATVADAIDRTQAAATLRGVDLRAEVPAGIEVLGDRRQLASALANLLDNAVKYSEADAGSSVLAAAAADGGWVSITVADCGMGIPGRDLERIFERFYRVDQARSRETGGTGLGLAIVRHVVQNHQGEVSVTSREGEGTTFTLRFPEAPPAEPNRADPIREVQP